MNFLDLTLIRKDNKILTNWYAKPTTSERILNYFSIHPNYMKLNVARSFIKRVLSLSDNEYKSNNITRIEQYLMKNNYPINIIKKLTRDEVYKLENSAQITSFINPNLDDNQQRFATLTYIPHLSLKLQNILKKMGVDKVSFKINNKLQDKFSKLKDKVPVDEQTHVIYSIPCSCRKIYIGQTSNSLKTRIQKHKSDIRLEKTSTAFAQHIKSTKHTPQFADTNILNIEKTYKKRLYLESLHILNNKNNINYKTDTENINETYKFILHTHNRYTQTSHEQN